MPRPALTQAFKPREPMTAEDRAYNVRMNPANQRGWIDKLTDRLIGGRLDTFEVGFVKHMDNLLGQGIILTDKQASRLEQIYADNTD